MHPACRLAPVIAAAMALLGCGTPPANDTPKGTFVITSSPAGASILVRDCPTCEDRRVAQTPYAIPEPASELDGKYLHLAHAGYVASPVQPIRAARGGQTRRIHYDLMPATAAGDAAAPADPADPADPDLGALRVTSAELTSSYRSALSAERAVYEPMSPNALLLVVSAQMPVGPGTEPGSTGLAALASGDETRLLGPRKGQERTPILTQRRLAKGVLAMEHAFSVPRGETGPYRLRVNGIAYPLEVTAGGEEAPIPAIAHASGAARVPDGGALADTAPFARTSPLEKAVAAAGADIDTEAPDTASVAPVPEGRPSTSVATVADSPAMPQVAVVPESAEPVSSAAGPGTYRLCAQVERYALCGERACRPDGLLSKTVLSCRVGDCARGEIPSSADPESRTLAGCVAACRQAQFDTVRADAQASAPVYCLQ